MWLAEEKKATLRTISGWLSLIIQCIALYFIIRFHPTQEIKCQEQCPTSQSKNGAHSH